MSKVVLDQRCVLVCLVALVLVGGAGVVDAQEFPDFLEDPAFAASGAERGGTDELAAMDEVLAEAEAALQVSQDEMAKASMESDDRFTRLSFQFAASKAPGGLIGATGMGESKLMALAEALGRLAAKVHAEAEAARTGAFPPVDFGQRLRARFGKITVFYEARDFEEDPKPGEADMLFGFRTVVEYSDGGRGLKLDATWIELASEGEEDSRWSQSVSLKGSSAGVDELVAELRRIGSIVDVGPSEGALGAIILVPLKSDEIEALPLK